MLTLYSYPPLFGVADNNGYGLKVFAFLRLAGIAFRHEHIFDASQAPRGQLPYIVDDGETVGDSQIILAHLTRKYNVTLDAGLTTSRRPLADVVNAARAAAGRTVGLIDSTKFGRASLVTIARAQELNVIITDDGLDESVAEQYRTEGVRLDIVNS